jgi:hypothetical protein
MVERAPTVTLLTDFGPKDSFIGIMKGVITSIAPGTVIIDLCHAVAPQDVVEAGFLLASSYTYFPVGTIHVAVVDPGVGTKRRILAIRAKDSYFIVPDNGLIVPTLHDPEDADEIVSVENDAYFLKPVSCTFHGRDIFAAIAAHLGKGIPLRAFGPAVQSFERGGFPPASEKRLPDGRMAIEGEVIHVDNFGNLITTVAVSEGMRIERVRLLDREIVTTGETYASVAPGELLSLRGSSGYLEVAANRGNAQEFLSCSRGEKVYVELVKQPM